jgi:peptide-methionine (S)-S-oxide reductase
VKNGQVGFMGPPTASRNPTYKEVRAGATQQVEVYHFDFEGDEKTYENLVKHFFMFHDPTSQDRQGEDAGTMYASVIYAFDEKQVLFKFRLYLTVKLI